MQGRGDVGLRLNSNHWHRLCKRDSLLYRVWRFMDDKAANTHPVHPVVHSGLEREETHLIPQLTEAQAGCESRPPNVLTESGQRGVRLHRLGSSTGQVDLGGWGLWCNMVFKYLLPA